MKTALLTLMTLYTCTSWAQGVDSSKTKPVTSLSKYQQPSRFGATQPMSTTARQQAPVIKSPTQSRVQSTYTYENGRVTGGSTSFKFGKKKD